MLGGKVVRTQNLLYFQRKKKRFVNALDLIKCRKLTKQQILLHTCASISWLLSNISTMIIAKFRNGIPIKEIFPDKEEFL